MSQIDPYDFSAKYNTKLSKQEEVEFQKWAKEVGREKDVYDYDLRGAWKEMMSGTMTESDNGHLGDKYKKPNHPTFSNQSIYHGVDNYYGGSWYKQGNYDSFIVGSTNMYSPEELETYRQRREPKSMFYDNRKYWNKSQSK